MKLKCQYCHMETILSYFKPVEQPENELLKMNNELNTIFSVGIEDGKKITHNMKFPELVIVGGQSSGKSSVANNIIGMDIFPTGVGIVTRTPICVQMTNIQDM